MCLRWITNPWPDPWVTLTAMGCATTTLRMGTNIYLAALRDPFTVSRATSAAAIFTNNRVVMGVSAGWLKEEFALAGVDFHTRSLNSVMSLNPGSVPADLAPSLRQGILYHVTGLCQHRFIRGEP